jgi:RNA polymerase sigma-70 factor, ECF subfamily
VDAAELDLGAPADRRADVFRHLIDRALDGAYRRAAVVLASRLEAEDAVHDAAERAWRARRSLRDEAQFDAWFARIVLNVCRDRLRRRRRVAAIEVSLPGRGGLPEPEDAQSTTAIGRVHERSRLLEALAVLSADERIAIVLRFDADLTIPQIAAATGSRDGTIKARLHHALRKLRAELGEEDPS